MVLAAKARAVLAAKRAQKAAKRAQKPAKRAQKPAKRAQIGISAFLLVSVDHSTPKTLCTTHASML